MRTKVDAPEGKLGQTLDGNLLILSWLIIHAALLYNRCHAGKDGQTPHQRLRGRKAKKELVEFGECVHWMPQTGEGGHGGNIDARWQDGVWLGIRMESDEVLIGTPTGIFTARSIQRKPTDLSGT